MWRLAIVRIWPNMGSTVAYGRGKAVVTATGMHTEMGKIGNAITQAEDGETPLQKKLTQLSKILTWLVLGICVFIFASVCCAGMISTCKRFSIPF